MSDHLSAEQTAARELAVELEGSCVGVRVGRLHRIVSRHYEQALRTVGLTLAQAEILSALTLIEAPARPSDLAEQLVVERSTISRNLALLQNRGLVQPSAISPTGRSLAVSITAEGTATLAAARDSWTEAQATMLGQLDGKVPATLDAWLGALKA